MVSTDGNGLGVGGCLEREILSLCGLHDEAKKHGLLGGKISRQLHSAFYIPSTAQKGDACPAGEYHVTCVLQHVTRVTASQCLLHFTRS